MSAATRTTLVVASATDPRRQDEALRAALGLTLRGAHVEVWVIGAVETALGSRTLATLALAGHELVMDLPGALARADAVEVWTDDPPPAAAPAWPVSADALAIWSPPVPAGVPVRREVRLDPPTPRGVTLHLVRAGATAHGVLEPDWIVELPERALADRGTPPLPPGPLSDDQLVQLVFAADRVVTW